MSEELKPCPFCGKNTGYIKKIVVSIDWIIYTSYCENRLCEASLGANNRTYDTPEEAEAAWNTRPLEAALQKRIEVLEAALDEIRLIARSVLPSEEVISDHQAHWNGKELYQIAKKAESALKGEAQK